MKKHLRNSIFVSLLLVVALLAAACSPGANTVATTVKKVVKDMPEHIYKIGEAEFVDKVKAGDDMIILDIRQEDVYNEGHVKGAVNIPWGPAISDNLNKIPQDKEVFIYCYTGQTAGQAVLTLNVAGINARSVNLGWNLGIAKVEGVEDVIETQANQLPDKTYPVDEKIAAAIKDYYYKMSEMPEKFTNYKISEDDLKAAIDSNEDIVILSVRRAEDYAEGHIPGAINIPFGNDMLNDLTKLPKNKKIAVYCYTGQTSAQATAALRLLGYDAVSMNAGTGTPANAPAGWVNKGYELVTGNDGPSGDSGSATPNQGDGS